MIEVSDADIAGLIDRALLDRLRRDNLETVQGAMHRFLDDALARPGGLRMSRGLPFGLGKVFIGY